MAGGRCHYPMILGPLWGCSSCLSPSVVWLREGSFLCPLEVSVPSYLCLFSSCFFFGPLCEVLLQTLLFFLFFSPSLALFCSVCPSLWTSIHLGCPVLPKREQASSRLTSPAFSGPRGPILAHRRFPTGSAVGGTSPGWSQQSGASLQHYAPPPTTLPKESQEYRRHPCFKAVG